MPIQFDSNETFAGAYVESLAPHGGRTAVPVWFAASVNVAYGWFGACAPSTGPWVDDHVAGPIAGPFSLENLKVHPAEVLQYRSGYRLGATSVGELKNSTSLYNHGRQIVQVAGIRPVVFGSYTRRLRAGRSRASGDVVPSVDSVTLVYQEDCGMLGDPDVFFRYFRGPAADRSWTFENRAPASIEVNQGGFGKMPHDSRFKTRTWSVSSKAVDVDVEVMVVITVGRNAPAY